MNKELLCPKCEAPYSQENPPKKLINCPHTLCLQCLKEEIVCPLDRKRIERRKYTVEAFQNNEEILAIMHSQHQQQEQNHEQIQPTQYSQTLSNNYTSKSLEKSQTIAQHYSDQPKTQFQTAHSNPKSQEQPLSLVQQQPSPAKQKNIQFDTCLLHSKKADLICLEDKCLICSSCGLFGEHKLHKIMPYDTFLANFGLLTEECLKTYEQLKERQDKLDPTALNQMIAVKFREKKQREVRSIKASISCLVDVVRKYEKQLISNLDQTINYKQSKFSESISFQDLLLKKNEYQTSVEKVSNGIEDVFNLQNIEQYIPFVDQNSPDSFLIKQGEYLILQIDNYWKEVQTRMEAEINEFSLKFKEINSGLLKDIAVIQSRDQKEILRIIQQNNQKNIHKPNAKLTTPRPNKNSLNPSSGKPPLKPNSPIVQNNEQDLLIGSNDSQDLHSPSPPRKTHISPIQPVQHFQCNIETAFAQSNNQQILADKSEDNQIKFVEIPMASSVRNSICQKRMQERKTVCQVNRSIGIPQNCKRPQERKQNDLPSIPRRNHGSTSKVNSSNNNSNFTTERELLSVLNEKNDNRKKKRIQLPEKYAKIYDDLCKDKLDILDLGGAFLGDQTIIHISEFFPSRNRLKSVKLMNNKITDELFPELLVRCQHIYSLNLSYNLLTERSLEVLQKQVGQLGQLQNITLSNNKIVLRNVKDRLQVLRKKGIKISL